ncbi:unnamed protein product [Diamesa hyperborea]
MTNMNMINELNNNTIFPINGNAKRRQLGDSIIDTRVDTRGLPGYYKNDDNYKPYTIYGNSGDDNDKLSVLPGSTSGSLSSITTQSVASSEPDPNGVDGGDGGEDKNIVKQVIQEKWWQTTLQVSIPFFIAGIGTIGAGIILGRVEHWEVFNHIPELFILVPALLGLKGNLDMCLASRLSTQANLGNMSSAKEIIHMVIGNIALVQVQATVAAFIVSMFAMGMGAILNGRFQFDHMLLVTASSMFTATSSCFVLDFVLVAVILLSKRFKMNPDNLATPLAASIGDVVSIAMLSFITSILFANLSTHLWITYVVIGAYCILLPFWIFLVLRNRYTRPVLKSGWVPVLSALFISGLVINTCFLLESFNNYDYLIRLGGLVLNRAVDTYAGFVVFQPIINGIGGNLVSVQASKISTMLHQSTILGIIPPHTKIVEKPWRALFYGVPYAQTARILILMSIPGQVMFIFIADFIHKSTSTIGAPFVLSYLTVSLIQIMFLLYIAHVIVHAMWKYKMDPDNSAIPYLTALGDLFGSSLLLLAFFFLTSIGHEYEQRNPDPTSESLLMNVAGAF